MPIVELLLLPIEELVPHEKHSAERARRLALDIAARRAVLRPIIVEERRGVIIDGHHRYHALRLLGARYVPAVAASYSRDIEHVDSWPLRLYMGIDEAVKIIEENVKRGPSRLVLKSNERTEELRVDPLDAYYVLGGLAARGNHGGKAVTVERPPLSPDHVVIAAMHGKPLPAKSTRHVTRLKHLYTPTPLSLLY